MNALVALAALLVSTAPQDQPPPGSVFLHPERIRLSEGGLAECERGLLFVPLVRADPASPTIAVEFHRFRARPEAVGDAPPVFRLRGGPGFEGLAGRLSRSGYYEESIWPGTDNALGSVLEFADLVVVGQRGIGTSRPHTLYERRAAEEAKAAYFRGELSEEEAVAEIQRTCREAREFWSSRGYDLAGFTVAEAAADVNDLRSALGYERVALYGGSFGSHWAMAVMRAYPATVARAVLGGIEGPDHTYDLSGDLLATLERIAVAAEASPQLATHVPAGGLVQALHSIVEDVEAQPFEWNGVRFDVHTVRRLALGYSGDRGRRSGVSAWPADVLALCAGRFDEAADWIARGAASPYQTVSSQVLDCSSGISPERERALRADPAGALLGRPDWRLEVSRAAWGVDAGDDFRASFETDVPTLLVQGDWDLSTPLENALTLLPFFENGKLVVVHGGSHAALVEALSYSADFRRAVRAFLARGETHAIPERVELPPPDWVVPPR